MQVALYLYLVHAYVRLTTSIKLDKMNFNYYFLTITLSNYYKLLFIKSILNVRMLLYAFISIHIPFARYSTKEMATDLLEKEYVEILRQKFCQPNKKIPPLVKILVAFWIIYLPNNSNILYSTSCTTICLYLGSSIDF